MFRVTIDASDLIAKINALGSDGQLARDIADAVADEAVIPELAKAPMRSGKKQPFRTAKQRAFFFAALKDGRIEVPYRRTGKIGMSEKHPTSNGVDVTVPAKYSDLVRTKKKQAGYHQGNWPTDQDIAKKIEGDTAELIGTAAVMDALRKAGLT
jgi:hypothetical protein